MDSRKYLNWAAKKEIRFDHIVCDPPSFSRNGKSIFKVERNFPDLISSCMNLLNPEGVLLFSTNFESWSATKWLQEIRERGWQQAMLCPVQSDFEGPEGVNSIQKAFKITKV